MLDWVRRKAAKKQESNIRKTLTKLIPAANEAYATIERLGDTFPQQRTVIKQLQDQLLLDLFGPIPLDEVKQRILDPAISAPGVSEGARIAVNHIYDFAVREWQGRR